MKVIYDHTEHFKKIFDCERRSLAGQIAQAGKAARCEPEPERGDDGGWSGEELKRELDRVEGLDG